MFVRSASILTLGCKVNTYESEYVLNLLLEHGYEMKSFDDKCDVYIINTCTVTNTSDLKSRKMIRRARRNNPDACVVAMGCYVEANDNSKGVEADIVVGTKHKGKVIEYIDQWFRTRSQIVDVTKELAETFEDMEIHRFLGRTRAFVKIQDGCENYCAYCIIPYVRGKCRSKDPERVVHEITELVQKGYREIVLTGIHTGNYGVDLGMKFADILKRIVTIPGLYRLRISSIEITELDDQVLELVRNYPVIVDHLHIPLQSGSEAVLKAMNRKYDKKYFLDKVKRIRSIRPNISLSTDVIVGFPGETEEDFEESYNFMKEVHFSKIHVFPYSKREGTKAALMELQISEEEKKRRVKRVLELSHELEIDYMKQFLGKELDVLVEVNREDYSLGHTSNYLLVKVPGNYTSETILNVQITSVTYPYCNAGVLTKQL